MIEIFSKKLKLYIRSQDVYCFSKGRVALYAALNSTLPKNLVLPGYTCLVVPTAGMIQGVKPLYVDIDPRTYNINPEHLEQLECQKPAALIVQHTYGIPCDMEPILAWASARGISVIEDCCLAFGSRYKGQLCGTFGIASYFSGQWNKPFSTGLGGMLIVNNEELAARVQALIDEEMIDPPLSHRFRIWLQLKLYERFITPRTVQFFTHLYRRLSIMGLMVGSSSRGEYQGEVPKNYFMRMTESQARKGVHEMERIEENISHRRMLSEFYQEELPKIGFQPVELREHEEPVFVRYPVRVRNRKEVLEAAYRERVEIGSWFESPLHPEGTDLQRFHYTPGSCPEAEKAAQQVINLPTHLKTSLQEAERVLEFLQRVAEPC